MTKFASTTAIAVLLLASPALAQVATQPSTGAPPAATTTTPPAATTTPPAATDTTSTPPAASGTMSQSSTPRAGSGEVTYVPAQSQDQWLATDLMGATVRGTDDQSIGEINDLLLGRDGQIAAAVIGVGGFLGIGEKDVAVPFTALQVTRDGDNDRITLSATKDQLRNAPEFKDLDDVEDENRTADRGAAPNTPATPMGTGASGANPAAPRP